MEDATERLIRQTLGRRPTPRLRPTFADDVLRRLAADERPAVSPSGARARRWILAASWLLSGAASVAALAHVDWRGSSSALAWGLGLILVPMAYSATLWPRPFLGLLALCGGPAPRHDGGPAPAGRSGR